MGVKQDGDGTILPPIRTGTHYFLRRYLPDGLDVSVKKFLRGSETNLEGLQGQLAIREELYGKFAQAAAKAEKWLLPSEGGYLEAEGMEKTWTIKQESIAREVDISSSRNQYDIVLPADDVQVRETMRNVVFLHNESFFAAAQKNYPYIYNRDGTELHCLKEHGAVLRLQFLKNHFLLASINNFGQLHYQDVTMGEMVVSMWKPTSSAPVLIRLCHRGSISAMAFHPNGHIMATAGKEKKIKLWDLRKLEDEALHTLLGQAKTLDFSQKGLLACLGSESSVQILRDLHGTQNYKTYMNHRMVKGYQIEKLLFRPNEDLLGIGHSMGWSSILIPGCGEPNFDSWVANPFETSKQRREGEVHSLLDKLPSETIMLDPTKIGTVKP
ncbi:putative U3 small nucleolar RNA-associated protein 7 [Prunus yedoensis var. nudiflora]|uniref:Putative U3 small nucleolar RNA-associated protein 7 n=1 Tax=Prunus yedoensis var. nudiflora TaxID=2094558 RepID=A0A314ZX72_PRUYE|nr:putative U3 small nucleolar RNA-associated protein 7 [Prunus yedoensis var. nudiflora]